MIKYMLGWLTVFAIRLLPFRPANVEPLMATLMPYSKHYGWWKGFLFAFLGIALFDVASGQVGSWTWITGGVYGLIGVAAHFYFRNRPATARHFVAFSIIGTLFFDAVTGVAMGPLLYGQPFMEAFTGQIPFTLRHLAGNIILALILSPLLDRWIVTNDALEGKRVLARLIEREARS